MIQKKAGHIIGYTGAGISKYLSRCSFHIFKNNKCPPNEIHKGSQTLVGIKNTVLGIKPVSSVLSYEIRSGQVVLIICKTENVFQK
jgi:hypothetical protein